MRRLLLTSAAALLVFLLVVPSAWAEWVWPLRGEVITPYRNGADPYASGQHRGIDIAGATGATVVAAASGEVRFAGTAGSSGLTVSVRTGDGRYDTSYLHLSSTAVREGDRVAAGQGLGAVGTTGTRSAEVPHLHFGVRDAASRHAYHDPLGFLPPPTATQPPSGAPAPQPAPVPVGPAPVPVPVHAPLPNPRRVPAGAPRRVPAPAPSPRRVPARAPRHAPTEAPRHAPARARRGVPLPAPSPGHVPAGAPNHVATEATRPVPSATPGSVPAGTPSQSPERVPIPSAESTPAGNSAGRTLKRTGPADRAHPAASSKATPAATGVPGDAPFHPEHASPAGPDLGLLLACLGLVVAAALLGLTRDGRKATRETRHRIARVLQPMLGRR